MTVPTDAFIAKEKLTEYLLIPKPKNDKSRFLARAGFTGQNATDLEPALRRLLHEYEAVLDRVDIYGSFYQVRGLLHGPTGTLAVITIWLQQPEDNRYRFVTRKPERSQL